jgi:hypothetical protein
MSLVMFLIQDQSIWCVSFKALIYVFFSISYLIKNHISYKNFSFWEICNTFVDHGHVNNYSQIMTMNLVVAL